MLAGVGLPGVRADDLPPLKSGDLDLAFCASFQDRQPRPASAAEVLGVVGLDGRDSSWSAGRVPDSQTFGVFYYRLAFRREIPLGTILADTTAQEVRVLRADAPYPGDPWNESHWTAVPTPPRQPETRTVPLPAGLKTRGLLWIDRRTEWRGPPKSVACGCFPAGSVNVAGSLANAYADREYTPPNTLFVPEPNLDIVTGKGRWVNTARTISASSGRR